MVVNGEHALMTDSDGFVDQSFSIQRLDNEVPWKEGKRRKIGKCWVVETHVIQTSSWNELSLSTYFWNVWRLLLLQYLHECFPFNFWRTDGEGPYLGGFILEIDVVCQNKYMVKLRLQLAKLLYVSTKCQIQGCHWRKTWNFPNFSMT